MTRGKLHRFAVVFRQDARNNRRRGENGDRHGTGTDQSIAWLGQRERPIELVARLNQL
jgi:hypothetical protein